MWSIKRWSIGFVVYWDCRIAKTEDPFEPKLEDGLERQINEKVMEIIFLKIINLTIKLLPVIKRVFIEQ